MQGLLAHRVQIAPPEIGRVALAATPLGKGAGDVIGTEAGAGAGLAQQGEAGFRHRIGSSTAGLSWRRALLWLVLVCHRGCLAQGSRGVTPFSRGARTGKRLNSSH